MALDTSRLLTVLNNTGLQTKDNSLYQLLKQLIESVNQLTLSPSSVSSGSGSGSGSSTIEITNNIIQQLNLESSNDSSLADSIMMFSSGKTGEPGRDGLTIPGFLFDSGESGNDLVLPGPVASGNGGVNGSGTTGTIVKFTGSNSIGDSLLVETADTISLVGRLIISAALDNVNALTVVNNGTTNANGLYVEIGASSTGIPFQVDKDGILLFQIDNTGRAKISAQYAELYLKSSVTSGSAGGSTIYFSNVTNDTTAWITYQHSANTMSFRINSTDIALFSSTGQLRLNTTTSVADARLTVIDSTYNQIAFGTSASNSGAFYHDSLAMYFISLGNTRMILSAVGVLRLPIYGAGTATFDASGFVSSTSDVRYKDRIAPLSYGLPEVLALQPVQHGYNELSKLEREHLYGGFIAQDVQKVMPIAVGMNSDGYLTLADRPIIGAIVNAIRTLDERLNSIESVM